MGYEKAFCPGLSGRDSVMTLSPIPSLAPRLVTNSYGSQYIARLVGAYRVSCRRLMQLRCTMFDDRAWKTSSTHAYELRSRLLLLGVGKDKVT